VRDREKWKESTQSANAWDRHLRSTYGVSGHHIQALDGEIGHVEDFIIDDETWAIRYLVVDTRNWWPGKKVLVSPQWIESVSWEERKVFVNLSRADHQGVAAIHGGVPADPGIRDRTASALQSQRILD
jgi:hypothetical protein